MDAGLDDIILAFERLGKHEQERSEPLRIVGSLVFGCFCSIPAVHMSLTLYVLVSLLNHRARMINLLSTHLYI